RAVNLSLERGNCDASCLAYVMLGRVAVQRFRDFKTAVRFGQIGWDLIEARGLKRFQAVTYLNFAANIAPWTKHVRTAIDLDRRAVELGDRQGDPLESTLAYVAW